MKLNEKIYEYRKQNRWSQEDLADKLDVSRQTISKWEVGKAVPELDKLIRLAELFNITMDELVMENIELVSEKEIKVKEDDSNKSQENINQNVNIIKLKSKKKQKIIKMIIVVFIILILIAFGMLYIQKRKLQIREIAKVYREEFRDDYDNNTFFVVEEVSRKENNIITETKREYYIYREKDKATLIKIKEYEDEDMKNLSKEIYIDTSKRKFFSDVDMSGIYDNVVEINVKDWSTNIINDYKFISPMDRVKQVFKENYFDDARYKTERKLAFDLKNNFFIIKHPEAGTSLYWSYGEMGNLDKEDFFQVQILPESNYIFFEIDDYKNDLADTREIVLMQITKLTGNKDDVTIPEL